MYKINENQFKEKYIVLIPAMLDAHFPLLKYAFFSKNYHPVILENEKGIIDTGLKYVNNDMCFPSICNIGQMIDALQSGKYDISRTRLLMPTAGDACRGSNYLYVLRRAIKKAGFDDVKVLSLNLKGLEKDCQMKLNFSMVWRALFGLFYGDILMLLLNHTRPYEAKKGAADKLWQSWVDKLAEDMKSGKHLTIGTMKKNFYRMAEDFAALEKIGEKKKRVGIVGELYIKYCHIGNFDMIRFLESEGCESHTNGVSWYAMYYMDSHLTESKSFEAMLYKIGLKFFAHIQNAMIDALKKNNMYTLEGFETLKREAEDYISHNLKIGDGWLIGSEAISHILHDCPKVIAVQPFGCMPNHCCGHGVYPAINRKFPQGHVVSVDLDSGAAPVNVYNRVKMLTDFD